MTTKTIVEPHTGKVYPVVTTDNGITLMVSETSYLKAKEALARDPNHVFTHHVVYSVSAQALVDAYESVP